jgi:hypothetical protein
MPAFVFRKVSLTLRERFTPARACSTQTRRRALWRFVRFSPAVRLPGRGFFSVAASGRPQAHTPESPCPWSAGSPADRQWAQ